MVSPHAGDFVDQRLQGVGIVGDISDAKNPRSRRRRSGCRRPAPRTPACPWRRRGDAARASARHRRRAPIRPAHRHHQRQRQREAQRQLAQFAGHVLIRLPSSGRSASAHPPLPAACISRHAWPALRWRRRCRSAFSAPVATTPWPSRNRAGSTPSKSTGTAALAVGDAETHIGAGAVMHAAFLHQPADAEGDARARHAWPRRRWGCGNNGYSVPAHRRSPRPAPRPPRPGRRQKQGGGVFLAFIRSVTASDAGSDRPGRCHRPGPPGSARSGAAIPHLIRPLRVSAFHTSSFSRPVASRPATVASPR